MRLVTLPFSRPPPMPGFINRLHASSSGCGRRTRTRAPNGRSKHGHHGQSSGSEQPNKHGSFSAECHLHLRSGRPSSEWCVPAFRLNTRCWSLWKPVNGQYRHWTQAGDSLISSFLLGQTDGCNRFSCASSRVDVGGNAACSHVANVGWMLRWQRFAQTRLHCASKWRQLAMYNAKRHTNDNFPSA